MNFSITEENYIKSIYHLQQQTATVTTNALADALRTKPASITDMLKKLEAKKLLVYEKYQGCKLNTAGNKVALHIIRRHRLWEFFLVNKLGFDWNKVHEIAEELEHVGSPELIEKLDHFLNFPSTDPHGDPIPDTNGKIAVIKQTSLHNIAAKKKVVVSSVSNQSKQMLELLKHYHISIGTTVSINKHFAFDGSIEIKVAQHNPCVLSEQVAKNILVHHE